MTLLGRLGRPRLPLNGLEIVLRNDRPLRLTGARGCRLRCVEGCVWLTAPGEPRDIYLFAGDTWEARCDGLILIEAAANTMVSIRIEGAPSHARPDFEPPAWRRLFRRTPLADRAR